MNFALTLRKFQNRQILSTRFLDLLNIIFYHIVGVWMYNLFFLSFQGDGTIVITKLLKRGVADAERARKKGKWGARVKAKWLYINEKLTFTLTNRRKIFTSKLYKAPKDTGSHFQIFTSLLLLFKITFLKVFMSAHELFMKVEKSLKYQANRSCSLSSCKNANKNK